MCPFCRNRNGVAMLDDILIELTCRGWSKSSVKDRKMMLNSLMNAQSSCQITNIPQMSGDIVLKANVYVGAVFKISTEYIVKRDVFSYPPSPNNDRELSICDNCRISVRFEDVYHTRNVLCKEKNCGGNLCKPCAYDMFKRDARSLFQCPLCHKPNNVSQFLVDIAKEENSVPLRFDLYDRVVLRVPMVHLIMKQSGQCRIGRKLVTYTWKENTLNFTLSCLMTH